MKNLFGGFFAMRKYKTANTTLITIQKDIKNSLTRLLG